MSQEEPFTALRKVQYLLVAGVLFSTASLLGGWEFLAIAAAAIVLSVVAVNGTGGTTSTRTMLQVASVAIVVGVVVSASSSLLTVPDASSLDFIIWLGPSVAVAIWILIRTSRGEEVSPRSLGGLAFVGVFIAGVQVMVVHGGSGVGIDVYASHLAAADALAHGLNPYTAAATFFDGFPGSPSGSMLTGYVYPPVTLVGYSLSTWLTGDPRWLNVVAWIAVLAVILAKTWRSESRVALAALLVLTGNPAWRLVVYSGWTEPLTIALLTFSMFAWRRMPRLATVLFGLALGSKQYMILLVPLLLLVPGIKTRRRFIWAQLVAIATMIPFVVWDADAFLDSVVLRQLNQGFRTDSQSLAGALGGAGGQVIYVVAGVLIVIGISFLLRNMALVGSLPVAVGIVLASFFAIAQGLVNYWFLVSALLAVGLGLGLSSAHDCDGRALSSEPVS